MGAWRLWRHKKLTVCIDQNLCDRNSPSLQCTDTLGRGSKHCRLGLCPVKIDIGKISVHEKNENVRQKPTVKIKRQGLRHLSLHCKDREFHLILMLSVSQGNSNFALRLHSIYCLVDELRQGSFCPRRRKKNKK